MTPNDSLHELCLAEQDPAKRVDRVVRKNPAAFRSVRLQLQDALANGLPGLGLELPGAGYVELSEPDDLYHVLLRSAHDENRFKRLVRALLGSVNGKAVTR